MAPKTKQANQAPQFWLGVNISPDWVWAALLDAKGNLVDANRIESSDLAFKVLHKWLVLRKAKHVHACILSYDYWLAEALAYYMNAQGNQVSMADPEQFRAYAFGKLPANAGAPQQAQFLAGFCRTQQPERWQPSGDPRERELVELHNYLTELKRQRQSEQVELNYNTVPAVRESIEHTIAVLDEQIADIEEAIAEVNSADAPTDPSTT